MPFIKVNDIKIYHEIFGHGPKLLFISGTGGDLRTKPNVLDSPLIKQFTVLAYDQRGLGQTTKPDRPYTMAEYAHDAAGLLDALGWGDEKVLVIGVSFGGMVAQEFAVTYPDKISRLALCCTSSGGAGGASFPLHKNIDLAPEERALKMLEISDSRFGKAWREKNPDKFEAYMKEQERIAESRPQDAEYAMGARRQLEARIDHDTFDRLANLKMPVGLFGGEFDQLASPQNMKKLQNQIPGATLEFFKGGHMFMMQDEEAYKSIIKFLEG